mmetsp:Transcript_29603/g.5342  ORF Transcript_29603/g.5342 Transcript_29603/m.5342 type:complete len:175 (-) Transcript_29603:38-562(-)
MILWQLVLIVRKAEKIILLNFMMCLNALLYNLTFSFLKALLLHKKEIIRVLLIIGSCFIHSLMLNPSIIFHYLKEQDYLKITAAYNFLTISDVLLRAYGKKCVFVLFSHRNCRFGDFVVNLIYTVAHSSVLLLQMLVIEVALYSGFRTLMLLIVSSSFVELKINVLKKLDYYFL